MKDYFGKNADVLKNKKLYLFDMDGTIYCENTLFDGVMDLLKNIDKKGGRYAFITNNPTKSVRDYVKKLHGMQITWVTEENFFTSAQAAAIIMKEKFGDALIYTQGTKSFVAGLRASGLNVTEAYTNDAKAILVAFDTEITGEKMRTTCEMLTKHDIPYYATNPDWVCPVDFGYIPDCGSMCQGYERATGKKPIFIGKPEPTMALLAMEKTGFKPEETAVMGDRLYTDIACGVNAGISSIFVLSGEGTMEDVAASDVKPEFIYDNIRQVLNDLKQE